MIKTVHFQTQDLSSQGLPLNAVNRNGGSKGINNTRDGGQGVSKMDIWKICIQNGYIGRYVSKMDTLEDMYPKCSYGHLDMTR